MKKIDDFDIPVELTMDFTQNNIPLLAHEVAKVHKGIYTGTEILVGMHGLMFSVIKDGEFLGHIGISYNDVMNPALQGFQNRVGVHTDASTL